LAWHSQVRAEAVPAATALVGQVGLVLAAARAAPAARATAAQLEPVPADVVAEALAPAEAVVPAQEALLLVAAQVA